MSWTLVPLATMWDPLALVPRMPLAYLLCNNQPFFKIFRGGNARIGQSPATTATGRNETSVSAEVDGGLGMTARADRPPAARDASESGDAAAPTSSLSAEVACASTSASAGARGTAPGQTLAALPAATSPDSEAQQSGLAAMAARLGTGALAGEMRTTPRASPPPAVLQHWLHRRRTPFAMLWALKRQAGTSRD